MTNTTKEAMTGHMQRSISDAQLMFSKTFLTMTKDVHGKISPETIQKIFREQLSNFRVELQTPNDIAVGITKRFLTGN